MAFDQVIPRKMCYCIYVVDSWRKAIEARKLVVAGFLDLAKTVLIMIFT